jgi:hypothetical protein
LAQTCLNQTKPNFGNTIRWQSEGPKGDKWLPAKELEKCEVLDIWQATKRM